MIRSGKLKVDVGQTYSVDQAHRDLEARLATGSMLRLPWANKP